MHTHRRTRSTGLLLISICSMLLAAPAAAGGDGSYDGNSWKTLITTECEAFFDGCNNCRREAGSEVAACTRMACSTYDKPRCLDAPITEGAVGETPFEGRIAKFACDGGNRFQVYHGEYVSGDQRMRLAEDEIMLSDPQTHTAYQLKRERSASGAKYSDGSLEFWEHGNEAMLRKDDQKLYQNCAVEG